MQPRLKKRSDFIKVATTGGYCPSATVIVQYYSCLPSANDESLSVIGEKFANSPSIRVGFTASKRVGNAVARNRAKRRLREAFEVISQKFSLTDCWIVLIAKPITVTAPYDQLLKDLTYALGRCVAGKFAPPKEPRTRNSGKNRKPNSSVNK